MDKMDLWLKGPNMSINEGLIKLANILKPSSQSLAETDDAVNLISNLLITSRNDVTQVIVTHHIAKGLPLAYNSNLKSAVNLVVFLNCPSAWDWDPNEQEMPFVSILKQFHSLFLYHQIEICDDTHDHFITIKIGSIILDVFPALDSNPTNIKLNLLSTNSQKLDLTLFHLGQRSSVLNKIKSLLHPLENAHYFSASLVQPNQMWMDSSQSDSDSDYTHIIIRLANFWYSQLGNDGKCEIYPTHSPLIETIAKSVIKNLNSGGHLGQAPSLCKILESFMELMMNFDHRGFIQIIPESTHNSISYIELNCLNNYLEQLVMDPYNPYINLARLPSDYMEGLKIISNLTRSAKYTLNQLRRYRIGTNNHLKCVQQVADLFRFKTTTNTIDLFNYEQCGTLSAREPQFSFPSRESAKCDYVLCQCLAFLD